MSKRLGFLVLSCLALLGCKCENEQARKTSSSTLPPLTERSWLVAMAVDGEPDAQVAVPLGAAEPRPVIIALHGSADRPAWQCGLWTGVSGGHAFVLCPTGRPSPARPGRYGWGDQASTERTLRASLSALKRRYGKHVAAGPVVLAGYGVGADRALALARKEPAFFARLAVVEGNFDEFSAAHAGAYGQRGGKRALFACASAMCNPGAERAALFLRRVGVDARSIRGQGSKKHVDARLRRELSSHWAWLTGT